MGSAIRMHKLTRPYPIAAYHSALSTAVATSTALRAHMSTHLRALDAEIYLDHVIPTR